MKSVCTIFIVCFLVFGAACASETLNYAIRNIQEFDVPVVYSQMKELVAHEGLTDYFKLTQERMHHDLFLDEADWNALVVEYQDTIIGFCFYSVVNTNRAFNLTPVINIDDIFVHPDFRGKGIGRRLLSTLAQLAQEQKIDRIELWCVKDNEMGQAFYARYKKQVIGDMCDFYKFLTVDLL